MGSTKTKPKSVAKLKKEADATFSQWVRRSAAGFDGYATCVTCNQSRPWTELQAGHYEKRGVNTLRYDERNVHPQCIGCNVFQHGNYPKYAIWMVETYGQSILKQLRDKAQVSKSWKAWELQEIIDTYKAKLSTLTP